MVYEMDQFAGDLDESSEKIVENRQLSYSTETIYRLWDLHAEDLKSRYLYNTNYVIWDNIGLEQQDRNIPAYQLMADVI